MKDGSQSTIFLSSLVSCPPEAECVTVFRKRGLKNGSEKSEQRVTAW